MLRQAYLVGRRDAFAKFALSPPSAADNFVAHMDQAKDLPEEPALAMPETPDPVGAAGQPSDDIPCDPAKAAALGLKDMLFFENMMGPDEAKNMFTDVHKQMSGQGGGRRGTLQIGAQGPQFIPHQQPAAPMPQRPMGRPAAPPPMPGAGGGIISSAPPPVPRMPLKR